MKPFTNCILHLTHDYLTIPNRVLNYIIILPIKNLPRSLKKNVYAPGTTVSCNGDTPPRAKQNWVGMEFGASRNNMTIKWWVNESEKHKNMQHLKIGHEKKRGG
jgi:hypothetical protein